MIGLAVSDCFGEEVRPIRCLVVRALLNNLVRERSDEKWFFDVEEFRHGFDVHLESADFDEVGKRVENFSHNEMKCAINRPVFRVTDHLE